MRKKKQNIEKEILGKIRSGEIQMKPKWKFVAEIWEKRTLWMVLILAAALSISGIIYFMEIYNPIELAEFGEIGRQVFLEDFPYYWLVGVIIFLILGIKTESGIGENYRKSTRLMFLISGMVAILVTLAMFLARKLFL